MENQKVTNIIISNKAPLSTTLEALTGKSWNAIDFTEKAGKGDVFVENSTGKKFTTYTVEEANKEGVSGEQLPSEATHYEFWEMADKDGATTAAHYYLNNNLLTERSVNNLISGYATGATPKEKYELSKKIVSYQRNTMEDGGSVGNDNSIESGDCGCPHGDKLASGGTTNWYKGAVEAKAPYNLGGWRKELPAEKRRKLAVRSRDGKLTRDHKYLSAGRALQALANVTTDAKTKELASEDAQYFFAKLKGSKMAEGGVIEKGSDDYNDFINYIHAFYGTSGLHKKMFNGGASDEEIQSAVDTYLSSVKPENFGGGDSLDRERVRDIMLKARGENVGESIYSNGGNVNNNVPAWKVYLDKMESFEVGTPVVYHSLDYKGDKVEESGEVINPNGIKLISLYRDKNYSGSANRVISPNWNNVESFFDANKRGNTPFEINPIKYGNGGSLKNSNMNNIEIQIAKIDSALENKNISNSTKTILGHTRKKLAAQLEAEKVAIREADRAEKKAKMMEAKRVEEEAKRAELKAKQMAHGKHLKHTTKKPVRKKVKKAGASKKAAPVRKKVVKKGKFHGLPKKVKKFNKGRSASDIKRDKDRNALPKGKRIARKGWMNQYGASKGKGVYYENRAGHADISKKHSLGEGGNV